MDNHIVSTLNEIDMWTALGEYLRRANEAATGNPYSAATAVLAGKVASLYGDIIVRLGDKAEAAAETRLAVNDNTRMGKMVYAAAKEGTIPPDKAISILTFLVSDSEKKANDLEAVYG